MDGLRITDRVINCLTIGYRIGNRGTQQETLVETSEDIWLELTMMASNDFWRIILIYLTIGYVLHRIF